MSEKVSDPTPPHGTPGGATKARHSGSAVRHENPTTQQMRIIGQRRAEAEEKLAHHLEQARHAEKEEHAARESAADHD
jgi:uncharacterized protein YfcZ (UPF0381/DUF406 family)